MTNFVIKLIGIKQEDGREITSEPMSEDTVYDIQTDWASNTYAFLATKSFSPEGKVERFVINQTVKENFLMVISEVNE